ERVAGERRRLCDIDRGDAGGGVRRAQHHGMEAPWRSMVGDVAAGAAEEGIVFLAGDRLADAEFQKRHGSFPGKNVPTLPASPRSSRANGNPPFPSASLASGPRLARGERRKNPAFPVLNTYHLTP